MYIYLGLIKLIRIKRQFKSTLNSLKLKFRQISYTLNIIRLQYIYQFSMMCSLSCFIKFYNFPWCHIFGVFQYFCFSFSSDLFFTRVQPSKMFDVLKEDFDYFFISAVLLGMFVVTIVTQKLSARRALSRAWK